MKMTLIVIIMIIIIMIFVFRKLTFGYDQMCFSIRKAKMHVVK